MDDENLRYVFIPAGPIAAMSEQSTMVRQDFSFKSYQPPTYIHTLYQQLVECKYIHIISGMYVGSTAVDKLPNEFDGWLSSVSLNFRHVQVVDEQNALLS